MFSLKSFSKGTQGENFHDQLFPALEPNLLSVSLKNLYNLVCRQLFSTSILFTHPYTPFPMSSRLQMIDTTSWHSLKTLCPFLPLGHVSCIFLYWKCSLLFVACLFAWMACLGRYCLFFKIQFFPRNGHMPLCFCGVLYLSPLSHSHILILIFVCIAFPHRVLKAHHIPNANRELGIGCHIVTT